ncbi:MAG: hypothetical protein AAGE84_26995 [Cyanobacteria bacterium P01_G01_bin.39]
MKFLIVLISLIIWLTPATALAQSNSNLRLTEEQIQKLERVNCRLKTIDDLVAQDIISVTQAQKIQQDYLSKSAGIVTIQFNSPAEIMSIINKQKSEQNISHSLPIPILSFAQILAVFSSFLLAIAVCWLAKLYLIPLLLLIPPSVYELLIYLTIAGTIATGYWLKADYIQYIALSGCLALIGALGFSFQQHQGFYQQLKRNFKIDAFTFSSMILFVVWTAVAMLYHSNVLGFLAIIALEAFWGFSVAIMPLTYFIGFRRRNIIARTMLGSLLLLIIELTIKITAIELPYFEIFAPGMRFMGTFVYFLGLLIVSSKWYFDKNDWRYWLMQGLTIVSGIMAFYFGALWQISQLTGIGGTLFILYVIEKYFELPWSRKTFAWAAFGLSLLLYACAWLIRNYPQLFLIG